MLDDIHSFGSRAKSKAENNITPLGFTKIDNQQYIYTRNDRELEIKEGNSSGEEDFKETSRFGMVFFIIQFSSNTFLIFYKFFI